MTLKKAMILLDGVGTSSVERPRQYLAYLAVSSRYFCAAEKSPDKALVSASISATRVRAGPGAKRLAHSPSSHRKSYISDVSLVTVAIVPLVGGQLTHIATHVSMSEASMEAIGHHVALNKAKSAFLSLSISLVDFTTLYELSISFALMPDASTYSCSLAGTRDRSSSRWGVTA